MDEPPEQRLTITAIVAGKRRMRLVRLSDGRDLILSEEACERHGLAEGQTVDEEILEGLDDAEQRYQAHEAALRLLSHRSRSESEMRTRLKMRGIGPEVVDDEIVRLQRAGLLDDEKFAQAWVADRQRMSPRGQRMLRYELLGRGITPEAAARATEHVDDLEVALDAARTRARKAPAGDYQAFATRVGGHLQRRGFGYNVIVEVLRIVWAELGGERAAADAFAETVR
jgi:regulatory protein